MREIRPAVLLCVAVLMCFAAPALAQPQPSDVITIGAGTPSGLTVDVPVFIRDVSGTPLGIDQPPGSRIQSYSIRVIYSPAAPIQSVTFSRAGITTPLTPTFESSPSSAGSISLLDTFQESTNLIPFTSNAPAPGNQVAHLIFTFAPSATPGTVVALILDPVLTQLTDQGGSAATRETVTNGRLTLVNGSITVPSGIPTLDWRLLVLLAIALAAIGIRARI